MLKVVFISVGLEHQKRGLESFTRQCFDLLKKEPSLNIKLFKGSGTALPDEIVVPNIRPTIAFSSMLARINSKLAYLPEHLSFALSLVPAIKREQPDVIFFSDRIVGHVLFNYRQRSGLGFKLLMHNGSPVSPPYKWDHVHHPAPFHYDDALAIGEPAAKHTLLPIGVDVSSELPFPSEIQRTELRAKLGLPTDRAIVLSVGAINKWHKRMDYVVKEVSAMATQPFLVLLGQKEMETPAVELLAERLLASASYTIRTVSAEEVASYHMAADCAVLASLTEGFGRVYVEALQQGIPIIAHDYRVTRFVLGDHGTLADLACPGNLTTALTDILISPIDDHTRQARRDFVHSRYAWNTLIPLYVDMIQRTAAGT